MDNWNYFQKPAVSAYLCIFALCLCIIAKTAGTPSKPKPFPHILIQGRSPSDIIIYYLFFILYYLSERTNVSECFYPLRPPPILPPRPPFMLPPKPPLPPII